MARINVGAKLAVAGTVLGLLVLAGAAWFSAIPTAPAVNHSPVSAKAAPSIARVQADVVKPVLKTQDKPLWSELSPAQRQVLMPLNADWDTLASIRKQKWLKIADRYSSMKPDAQQRVQKRMHDWVNLTPKQRRIARENYARAKMKPGQRWAQWKRYQELPTEQKKMLASSANEVRHRVCALVDGTGCRVGDVNTRDSGNYAPDKPDYPKPISRS